MNEWIDELTDLAAAGEPAVLVTVAGIRGSAPREIGAKMIVSASQTIGTIGGGQLEYQSTRIAVDLLGDNKPMLRSFPLGSSMGQCCGGVVEVLFEPVADEIPGWLRDLSALYGQRTPAMIVTRISRTEPHKWVVTDDAVFGDAVDGFEATLAAAGERLQSPANAARDMQDFFEPVVAPDLNIAVFGAGHVGSAVVNTLSGLDCSIRWVDSRRNIFRKLPTNVRAVESDNPAQEVAAMPPRSFYLVMTHSHAIDFDVCERILHRNDARYCGLIGSLPKRRRFEKRYQQQGMPSSLLQQLVCPIGVDGISGKKPAEIAVAAVAEILKVKEQGSVAATSLSGNVRVLRS